MGFFYLVAVDPHSKHNSDTLTPCKIDTVIVGKQKLDTHAAECKISTYSESCFWTDECKGKYSLLL